MIHYKFKMYWCVFVLEDEGQLEFNSNFWFSCLIKTCRFSPKLDLALGSLQVPSLHRNAGTFVFFPPNVYVRTLTQRQGGVSESVAQSVAGVPAHLHGSVSSGCVDKSPHGLIKRLKKCWLTQVNWLQEV